MFFVTLSRPSTISYTLFKYLIFYANKINCLPLFKYQHQQLSPHSKKEKKTHTYPPCMFWLLRYRQEILCLSLSLFACVGWTLPCSVLALLYSLRCVVFRGVIWSSSCRYGSRPAGAQHPPGDPAAELPVEAGHEHLSGCPGAAGWPCQGKDALCQNTHFQSEGTQTHRGFVGEYFRILPLVFFLFVYFWPGEGGGGLGRPETSRQLHMWLHRVPVQPSSSAPVPRPPLHDRRRLPVSVCVAHRTPRHAGWKGRIGVLNESVEIRTTFWSRF